MGGCGPGSALERLTDATASLSALRLDQDRKTPSRGPLYFVNSLLVPRDLLERLARFGHLRELVHDALVGLDRAIAVTEVLVRLRA